MKKFLWCCLAATSFGLVSAGCKKNSQGVNQPSPNVQNSDIGGNTNGSCLKLSSIPLPESVDPLSLEMEQVTFTYEQQAHIRQPILAMSTKPGSATPALFFYKICQIDRNDLCLEGTNRLGSTQLDHIPSGKLKITAQACVPPQQASNKSRSFRVTTEHGIELYCGRPVATIAKHDIDPGMATTNRMLSKRQAIEKGIKKRCARIYNTLIELDTPDLHIQTIVETALRLGPEAFCHRLRVDLLTAMEAVRATDRYAKEAGSLKLAEDNCYDSDDFGSIGRDIDTSSNPFTGVSRPVETETLPLEPAEEESQTEPRPSDVITFEPQVIIDQDDLEEAPAVVSGPSAGEERSIAGRAVFALGAIAAVSGSAVVIMTVKDAYLLEKVQGLSFAPEFIKKMGPARATPEIESAAQLFQQRTRAAEKNAAKQLEAQDVARFYDEIKQNDQLFDDEKLRNLDDTAVGKLNSEDQKIYKMLTDKSSRVKIEKVSDLDRHREIYGKTFLDEHPEKKDFGTRSWFGTSDAGSLRWAQMSGIAGVVGGIILMIGASSVGSSTPASTGENTGLGLASRGITPQQQQILDEEAHRLAKLLHHDTASEIALALASDLKR